MVAARLGETLPGSPWRRHTGSSWAVFSLLGVQLSAAAAPAPALQDDAVIDVAVSSVAVVLPSDAGGATFAEVSGPHPVRVPQATFAA
ncbi:hypothetical protein AcV5_003754 [Taiwanofungus camphoratus]|nr:hypothetical protein AcV5_003754 [Antrodia cinnamomea]